MSNDFENYVENSRPREFTAEPTPFMDGIGMVGKDLVIYVQIQSRREFVG